MSLYFTFRTEIGREMPNTSKNNKRNTNGSNSIVIGGVYPKIIIKIPSIPNSIINIKEEDKQLLMAGMDLGK